MGGVTPDPVDDALHDKNNWYIITRSADNHYYVPGAINGHPVTFMIDTGASSTAIGLGVARNAGIKAGESGQAQTANGVGGRQQSQSAIPCKLARSYSAT